jgi:PadR family transcriptional regulator, regulatory protein AphA
MRPGPNRCSAARGAMNRSTGRRHQPRKLRWGSGCRDWVSREKAAGFAAVRGDAWRRMLRRAIRPYSSVVQYESGSTRKLAHVSLRYAILGYLSTAPGSGYDLTQQLDGGLGWFWSALHSQIYPELRRLEAEGLIEGSATTVGEKLEKRVYSITSEGAQALEQWASEPPMYRPNRDPERLQLIFADLTDIDTVRAHLEAHRAHFDARRRRLLETRERIRSGRHPRIAKRLEGRPKEQQALTLLLRDLAYSGDIERAQLEIEWAEAGLAKLDEMQARRGGTGRD